ncbi:MAG: UDP-N-acetylmuramate--L-alanine ligase [Kiritimatiellae bacterium]|nr:UDP-N-acetylmuramate--L-alanine ligase [Kiritimatiellia bacterium]
MIALTSIFTAATPGRAHFVGIGGVGMAGLAYILHRFGWTVSGCDSQENSNIRWLEELGVAVSIGHSATHAESFDPATDIVIYTPAVSEESEELLAFKQLGVAIYRRGRVLAELSKHRKLVAVCGSHGKTTTATYLAALLQAANYPSLAWCIGGSSRTLPHPAGGAPEAQDSLIVTEADESDGTLAEYSPFVTVITNVDLDHIDHFESEAAFANVFTKAVVATQGFVFYNADAARASKIVAECDCSAKVLSYGAEKPADFALKLVDYSSVSPRGEIITANSSACFTLENMPGKHNLYNAAAAIAAASALGVSLNDAATHLSNVASLPARRFEHFEHCTKLFKIISDYAHHPEEIKALISAAKLVPAKRIVAVFQPHRYSRTKNFIKEFPEAFIGCDEVIIPPVYSASEPLICGGTNASLYASFRKAKEADPATTPEPIFAATLESVLTYLRFTLRKDDLLLLVGAGDIIKLLPELQHLQPIEGELVQLGSYGTKGYVVKLTENIDEFVKAEGPKRVVGHGTNLFVSGTGYEGTILRLPKEYSFIKAISETQLEVGAATPSATVLNYCKEHGLSGLEYMSGIPGNVGGWLAMNAGTRQGAICDVVKSVTVLDPATGAQEELSVEMLAAGYHCCPGLVDKIVLSCVIELCKSTPDAISAEIASAKAKRFDFSGLRTEGSVFRNPPDAIAGKLSDEAGCKGMRIGAVRVIEQHGNIIATESGATASDVAALIQCVREKVYDTHQILLDQEIVMLG